ncbi:hypothetical protein PGB90_004183 [Kerria lacca]
MDPRILDLDDDFIGSSVSKNCFRRTKCCVITKKKYSVFRQSSNNIPYKLHSATAFCSQKIK